jgi:PAS domain S-box-containing protein
VNFVALKIQDLIDIEQFQMLQERLDEIYSFPSSIIDNEGNILTATAWQDICTKFHRQNSECLKECIKSDQYIISHLHEANPAVSYICPHGLVDNATPIIIEGVHYGNYFTGQFFLEPPDLNFFRGQAKRYGFDEQAYIEAVKKVPIWTQEKLNSYLFFIKGLIEVISGIGLKNLKEIETAERIKASEEQHRTILQTAMDGFCLIDLQGRIVDVNQAYCHMSGYDRQELLGMTLASLEATESVEDTAEHIRKVVERGYDLFETQHRRKNGQLYDIEVSVQYQSIGGGYFVTFFRDITERKRKETELREGALRLQTVASAGNVGFWDWNLLTDEVFYSPEWKRQIGYDDHEISNNFDEWRTHVHPDDLEQTLSTVMAFIEKPWPNYKSEFRFRHKDGSYRWILAQASLIYDEQGKPIRMLGAHLDITERKGAEEALRQSEVKFRTLMESAPEAIFVQSGGQFIYVNKAMLKLLGASCQEELLGHNFMKQIPHEYQNVINERICFQKATGKPAPLMGQEYLRLDGSRVPVETTAVAIQYEGKEAHLVFVRNIDDRKRAEAEHRQLEERLVRSEKMESLGTLAGGVAHDLNNVLGVVIAFSELLLDKIDETSPLRSYVKHIMDNSDRAAAIVDDLLTMARRGVQTEKVFNLNSTITDYQKTPEYQKLLILHPHVQVETHLDSDLMNIQGSPVHLSKTIMNLVTNGLEAMPQEGRLTITTGNQYLDRPVHGYDEAKEGDYVVLSVTDTGEGMSADDMKRVFEPFYTKKSMGKSGTGLGLSVVWGTVKDHKGYIDIQSEVDKGSTFILYFPVTREDIAKQAGAVPVSDYMGKGEFILIVDDVFGQRELATQMLMKLNYQVESVSSGEEAIAYLKTKKPDLIVLDMIMEPGMDGLETYKRIIALSPGQKAIIVSGFAETDKVKNVRELGAGAFVKKPYMSGKLGVAIRTELER